jgi:metal-responsive CopG/Arc/MetJ family transcriptional regulator
MNQNESYKLVQVYLTKSMFDNLKQFSKDKNINISKALRIAVKKYIDERKAAKNSIMV